MIFVNFKTYENGTGEKAVNLAKICQQVEKETQIKIIPVVQAADIWRISQLGIEVWAQHVDDLEYGPNTGQTLLEAVFQAGAKGVLLNHSENKMPVEMIGEIIDRIKNTESRIKVLVCAESVEEGKEMAEFKPDLIAYEPPELIGGEFSVSQTKPEVIADFIKEIPEIPVLVGAGINTGADVNKSIELGAVGVLVSNAVVQSPDPQKILRELANSFKNG